MRELMDALQFGCAVMGGVMGAMLGGWDGFLYALVLFVVLDYGSGVLLAISEKKLSSAVGFKGIAKKVAIFLLVAMANVVDAKILQHGAVIRTAVIFFYLSNEGISILENIGALGLPIPGKLREVLEQLKEE